MSSPIVYARDPMNIKQCDIAVRRPPEYLDFSSSRLKALQSCLFSLFLWGCCSWEMPLHRPTPSPVLLTLPSRAYSLPLLSRQLVRYWLCLSMFGKSRLPRLRGRSPLSQRVRPRLQLLLWQKRWAYPLKLVCYPESSITGGYVLIKSLYCRHLHEYCLW